MWRDLGLSWLALLLVGGAGCAGVDDSLVDAAADANGSLPDGPDPLWCIEPINTLPQPQPADVLILFDRSGSMDTNLRSGTPSANSPIDTRYQRALWVLSDLVTTYDAYVRFGYQELPGRQDCPTPDIGCCASQPTVGVALNNATAIMAAMTAALPVQGSTPAAGALLNAFDYFNQLADGVTNRYVLLATHGMPTCDLGGHLASADTFDASGTRTAGPCFDALAQVGLLVSAGIKVIVLNIDDGLSSNAADSGSCLDSLAAAGGVAATSFLATELRPPPLRQAVQRTFAGPVIPSCDVLLQRSPILRYSVQVYLDGQPVSSDGAELVPSPNDGPSTVHFKGDACTAIQDFHFTRIEIRGCSDCIEQGCDPL